MWFHCGECGVKVEGCGPKMKRRCGECSILKRELLLAHMNENGAGGQQVQPQEQPQAPNN